MNDNETGFITLTEIDKRNQYTIETHSSSTKISKDTKRLLIVNIDEKARWQLESELSGVRFALPFNAKSNGDCSSILCANVKGRGQGENK